MKTIIDNYRGFEITFDTDSATFSAWSDHRDAEVAKKSYAAVKKGVDDYIKANSEWKPILVQYAPISLGEVVSLGRTILLTGIRKDGKPTCLDENGNKKAISSYNVRDFILLDKANEPIKKEFDELKKAFKEKEMAFGAAKKELLSKVKVHKLTDYIKEYQSNQS